MKAEIRKDIKGFTLVVNGEELVHSPIAIEPAFPQSSIYKIYHHKSCFFLYCADTNVYVRCKKVFYEVNHFSTTYHTFAAWYHSDTGDDLCSLIYPDGNHLDKSVLSISDEKDGIRIVNLNDNRWVYYNEESRQLEYHSGKAWHAELGFPFMRFGSFVQKSSRKRYLWYYNIEDKFKTGRHIFTRFKITLADDYIPVSDSHFFVGVDYLYAQTSHAKSHYSLFHIDSPYRITRSESWFEEWKYISSIRAFLVKSDFGWTLVSYNTSQGIFESIHSHYYHHEPEIRVMGAFIFIRNDYGHWDFITTDHSCNSFVWQQVDLDDSTTPGIHTLSFDAKSEIIPLDQIRQSYKQQVAQLHQHLDHKNFMPYLSHSRFKQTAHDLTCCSFYGYGAADEVEGDKLCLQSPLTTDTLHDNDNIAWISSSRPCLYVVRFHRDTPCTIQQRILISPYDANQFQKLADQGIRSFNTPCAIPQLLHTLRLFAKSQPVAESGTRQVLVPEDQTLLQHPTEDFSVQTDILTDITEQPEPLEARAVIEPTMMTDTTPALPQPDIPSVTAASLDFLHVLRDTYQFLIRNSEKSDVLEVLYILFHDRVKELYHISEHMDRIISEADPDTSPDNLIDGQFIEDYVKSSIPEQAVEGFDICMKYKIKFDHLSVSEALDEAVSLLSLTQEQKNDIRSKIEWNLIDLQQKMVAASTQKIKDLFARLVVTDEPSPLVDTVCTNSTPTESLDVSRQCTFFSLPDKDFILHLNDKVFSSDLKIGNQTHINKGEAILIVLPSVDSFYIDMATGRYELIGLGQDQRFDQDVTQLVNAEIIRGKKRILLFIRESLTLCRFYDEVSFLSYRLEKEETPYGHRNIILFTLQSMMRY